MVLEDKHRKIQFTDKYIDYDSVPSTKDDTKKVNPYFHYGPLWHDIKTQLHIKMIHVYTNYSVDISVTFLSHIIYRFMILE